MSRGIPQPSIPKETSVYSDADRDMLESLKGLSIKNFHDCNDGTGPNTPSSTNASLPTPPALKSSQVFLASAGQSLLTADWYHPVIPPNAPLMKDLDSFTDGTGASTFDFALPGADPDDIYPILIPHADDCDDTLLDQRLPSPTQTVTYEHNSLALALLPATADPKESVLAWREGVSATDTEEDTTPKKRRRSLTASSEAEARRVRAWTPTNEPSHAPQPSPRKGGFPTERQEPEAPD